MQATCPKSLAPPKSHPSGPSSVLGSATAVFGSGKLIRKPLANVSAHFRDFDQLVHGDGATLDRPKYTVEDAFSIGPVDVKISPDGTKVATSSVDNSLRVFSLQEESKEGSGRAGLLCEATADVAEAWRIDFSADGT